MTDDASAERLRYLIDLAVEALSTYGGGLADLGRLVDDVKIVLQSSEGLLTETWLQSQTRLWGQLEIIRALALDEKRQQLRDDEEDDVRQIVASLLTAFRTLSPG